MKSFIQMVKEEQQKQLLVNVQEVRQEIKEEWVQVKIQRYLASVNNLILKEKVEKEILDGAYWKKYREELVLNFKNNSNVKITSIDEETSHERF